MNTIKKQLSDIFFQVEKVSSASLTANPDMEYNSENAYAILATWPKEGKPRQKTLNHCSSIYKLIENKHVLEPLIPVLEDKFKNIDVFVSSDKDAQFTVRIAPLVPFFSQNTEVIRPCVTFTNSYDGKVLAQATFGLVRHTVDENGNVFTTYSSYLKDLSYSYTFKHSNENIYSMHVIAQRLEEWMKDDFVKIEQQIELLKAVKIEKPTTKKLETMVRNLAKGTVFPLKEVEDTIDRIKYEMEIFDDEPTLWSVYNSMNYILETSESSLTQKMRIDADAKIYANVAEFLSKKAKKQPALVA